MRRRLAGALVLAGLLAGVAVEGASGHAGVVLSDPVAGARLGASPTAIRLVFSEKPEPSLSSIRVLDANGTELQSGPATAVENNVLALAVPVQRLPRGVYRVSWRIVSGVDGHATSGAYAFGVRVSPTGTIAAAPSASPAASRLEMLARWLFLGGLVVLIGAAAARVGRFGGPSDVRLGAVGWALSAGGLLLLAEAQRRTAHTSLGDLLDTSVGHALVRRAVALAVAGGGLLLARRSPRRGMPIVVLGSLWAVLAHVQAGHAAAGPWPHGATIAAQSAHIAAAGVWLGGLAALLLGVRGAPSAAKGAAVRRFSNVALAGLVVVAVTGTVRAVDELGSVGELFSTGYGRAIGLKVLLLLAIVGFGARNRRRSVPAAGESLGLLRQTSRGELGLAVLALAVAAVLGTLAPPAAGQRTEPLGLSDSGADAATTVRVDLTAASDEPGPNRFVARVKDYDSKDPVRDARVSLRFTPLDDPGVGPTTLALTRGADGTYAGSGGNMSLDGRWGVSVLVRRAAGSAEVPLELDARGPAQIVVTDLSGPAPKYSVQVDDTGYIRFSPDPAEPGRSKLYVTCYSVIEDEDRIARIAVTAQKGDGPVERVEMRRLGTGSFVGDLVLERGTYTFAAVSRRVDGTRMRATADVKIPLD